MAKKNKSYIANYEIGVHYSDTNEDVIGVLPPHEKMIENLTKAFVPFNYVVKVTVNEPPEKAV